MKTEFDKVFLDTNILVYSTFEDYDAAKHIKSREAIDSLSVSGKTLFISPQVLREFYAVSTNKNIFKKPLTGKQAVQKIKEFLDVFSVVFESENTIHRLITLLDKHAITRQKVHDMNIAATMLDNNIRHLVTFNRDDFKIIKEITMVSV